jgi:WD40 repeat protein
MGFSNSRYIPLYWLLVLACVLSLAGSSGASAQSSSEQDFSSVLDAQPREVAYSPDGNWIAVSTTATLSLFDTKSMTRQWSVSIPPGKDSSPFESLTFSGDSALLASYAATGDRYPNYDAAVWLVRVSDGAVLHMLHSVGLRPFNFHPGIAFTHGGALIAAATDFDGTVQVWSVADGSLLNVLTGHTIEVKSVAFSADDQFLTTADAGLNGAEDIRHTRIALWRVTDGAQQRTMQLASPSDEVTLSPDGTLLYARFLDKQVTRYDLTGSEAIPTQIYRPQTEKQQSTSNIAVTADGMHLLAAFGRSVLVWDATDGSGLQSTVTDVNQVAWVASAPDGQIAVTSWRDAKLHVLRPM